MKNILVISTSFRKGSNSDGLADEFIRGAVESGNKVEKINLEGKEINFCRGCLSCQSTKKCVIHDDANEIVDKMMKADVIVFATPIYYYEMCGQMKTLLDRSNPLYPSDYSFRDIYLLATAADDAASAANRAVSGLGGWVECYEKASLKGVVFAGGVSMPNEIKGHAALEKAYELGKNA